MRVKPGRSDGPSGDAILPAKYFRVMGDPIRLRIIELVRDQERSVGQLAELLGQPQPKV